MFVVICEPEDTSGLWLATELENRGISAPVILPDELIVGSELSLQFGSTLKRANVKFPSGTSIESGSATTVINRMIRFPVPILPDGSDEDRIYSAEEARAAVVAWFSVLDCQVLQRPTPYDPTGYSASDLIWRCRAESLGIKSEPIEIGASRISPSLDGKEVTLIQIGDQVLADCRDQIPDEAIEASNRLAASYSPDFLAMRFVIDGTGNWVFTGSAPQPDLSSFGSRLVDVLINWNAQQ